LLLLLLLFLLLLLLLLLLIVALAFISAPGPSNSRDWFVALFANSFSKSLWRA